MVYGGYIYIYIIYIYITIIHGVSKPTNITGGGHSVAFRLIFELVNPDLFPSDCWIGILMQGGAPVR